MRGLLDSQVAEGPLRGPRGPREGRRSQSTLRTKSRDHWLLPAAFTVFMAQRLRDWESDDAFTSCFAGCRGHSPLLHSGT